jgi:predicted DNA-binding protein (UPF0251 family)
MAIRNPFKAETHLKPEPEPEHAPEPIAITEGEALALRLTDLVERLQGGLPSPDSVERVRQGLLREITLARQRKP